MNTISQFRSGSDKFIGIGDRGLGGALPTLENFAKVSHNLGANQLKIGQKFRKQWIFYRAAPLNFISPYAYGRKFDNLVLKILSEGDNLVSGKSLLHSERLAFSLIEGGTIWLCRLSDNLNAPSQRLLIQQRLTKSHGL